MMKIEIVGINNYGNGYGLYNNKKVLVYKTCIGDIIEYEIIRENKEHIFAKIKKILKSSKNRIDYKKVCPIYDFCGGCNLLHLEENIYYNFKKTIISNILQKLSNINVKDFEIIKIGFNSRRRATLQVKNNKIGFFEKNTKELVEINNCPLIKYEINNIIYDLKNIINKIHSITEISIVSYENGLGLLFTLNNELNINDNNILLNFVKNNKNIITLSYSIKGGEPYLFIQNKLPELTFNNGIKINLPINTFLQATVEGQNEITNIVIDNLKNCKKVLDLYCGIGTYSFPLSSYTKIHAVEGSELMIQTIQQNIKNNKLNNKISTECRNLVNSPLLLDELNKYDGIVINPPRNGAGIQCELIAKSNIKIIVMVSCNPETFASDAKKILLNNYKMIKIVGIDQFYKTSHLEIVSVFKKF